MTDEYAIADHIDPARWPFHEQRAREAAANVAYPNPPQRTRTRNLTDYDRTYGNAGAAANAAAWRQRRRAQRGQQ